MLQPWYRRAVTGIAHFMWAAVASAVVSSFVYWRDPEAWDRSDNTPYRVLLAAYLGIAIVSGGIWGMLRPLAKGTLTQAAAAAVAAWPPAIALVLATKDVSPLRITVLDLVSATALALFVGPLTLGIWGAYKHLKLTGDDA